MGSLSSAPLKISEATIRADAERLSILHSWYKHLRFPVLGTTFILYFEKGEQPHQPISPEVTDTEGLHLHITEMQYNVMFIDQLPVACRNHPVVLTKNFCGNVNEPSSQEEQDRQEMIRELVVAGCSIARALDILVE
jgi:hypothetical protein